MTKEKALLLDVTYFDDKEASIISLFVQREGKHYWLKDNEFRPYFYVLSGFSEKEKVVRDIKGFEFGVEEKFNVLRVEDTNKSHNSKSVIKIVFNKVSQLISARKILSEMGFERYEYDVPYAKRYLIDNRLEPGNFIEYEVILEEKINSTKKEVNAKDFESEEGELVSGEEKIVKEISVVEGNFEGKGLAFDLETYSREKFGIGFEPIIMTSIVSSDLDSESKEKSYERVLSYNTASVKGLELVSDEKELIKETIKELNKKENSFVITYNGDNFDFAYLKERARKNKLEFKVNNSFVKSVRHGRDNAVKLLGVQHIDSFQIVKLLARTGAINTVKMDIETISEKVFGEFKEKVYPSEINEAWEEKNEEKLERLVDYNLKDSRTALRIAKEFLPLFVELSKLTSQTLYDTTRSTTSQMVEDLLLKEAHLRGMIAPNKPKEGEIQERSNNPIKGAFVKEPTSGLHENIAVLDFASLYPSIIISHNLSPETLNCGHEECKQKNSTPDGTWFCTKQKGLFPEILEKMLKQRLVLKKEYKRKKKEEGIDDKILFAKQWALKIVLNSAYGYLAYARARWYSRECASATTALARGYIKAVSKKAEDAGFKVLYNDTDSEFLQFVGQDGKKKIEELLEKTNSELPEGMELELDGFYKRGIFVTKKEGGAAKKKYALIDEKGNLKIVGFEYVRRDWCIAAKETQKKVIELVLNEGKPEQAILFVKKMLADLKEGKVLKKDLVIMTLLQREIKDYTSIGPHVAAAKKAIDRGKKLGVGNMLSFIITKGKGKMSISQKAELEEYVSEGDYDADYYIENQVLPAVIKIMQELGYTKEDLISGGKQTGLSAWG